MNFSRRTIIGIIVLIIIAVSIPVALQLVKTTSIFRSRASTGANLLRSDMQNGTLRVSQKTYRIESGTYQLSGNVNEGGIIQVDEYDASNRYIKTHPVGQFTIPSGNYGYVILRALYSNSTFSNISLRRQQ